MNSKIIDIYYKIFKQIEQNGHSVITEKKFVDLVQKEAKIDEEQIKEDLADSKFLSIRETNKSTKLISTLKSELLEKQVVEQLIRLSKSFKKKKEFIKLTVKEMRLGKGKKPSEQQILAVNMSANNAISVITGGPGTGKTTLILALVRALKSIELNIQLCAPTGKAAKRLGEATGLQKFKPSTIHKYLQKVSDSSEKHFDVMIIDEASMIDIVLLHNLLATIPDGSQLILIGDKDQLPPIALGQPFKDLIQVLEIKPNLEQNNQLISRSGLNGIVVAAYDIIKGIVPDKNFNLSKDNFEFIECSNENLSNFVLDYYFLKLPKLLGVPFDKIKDEIQILTPQRTGEAGSVNLNSLIQEKLTMKGEPVFEGQGKKPIRFYKYDRVIQTSNDYEIGVMNGEIGNILYVNEKGVTVFINGRDVLYTKDQVENLELAYATTIHKSQGSEYEAVIIPISNQHFYMLNQLGRNLIYTAVTRGKNKVCLIGNKEIFSKVIKSEFKNQRNTGLRLELLNAKITNDFSFSRLSEIYRQK